MGALDTILALTGKTADEFRSNSKIGQIHREHGIRRTREFERIWKLPRRDWERLSEDGYLEKLSEHLRAPGGTMTLRPAQVATLTEAHDFGGCLGQIGLGEGKTLITALLPTILDVERPVLLAPAKLRDKTARDFQKLRAHWMIHPKIEFISYEQLGRDQYKQLLFDIGPDLIMCDEVQKLKNMQAGVTKRVRRYMRKHSDTMFVGLSGTITKRSLHDYWHLLMWALGPDLMPVPSIHPEMKLWALAVDEKVDDERRVAPGSLLLFGHDVPHEALAHCESERERNLTQARLGLQLRLGKTPGFIMTRDVSVSSGITLELVRPPRSEAIEEALRDLRVSGQTYNGEVLVDQMDVWRVSRQYGCGFYYIWDPPAPTDWRIARRDYNRFVRQELATSRTIDTPLQVQLAIERGELTDSFEIEHPEHPDRKVSVTPQWLLERWLAVRPSFVPKTRAEWIDDSYMRFIVRKYLVGAPPTLVWVEHRAVGHMLSKLSGAPFCHQNARTEDGRFIEDLTGQHVICSIASCGEGLNLQAWSRNFIVSCPPAGPTYEQLIGRTHRQGQEADVVELLMLRSCPEQEEGLAQAMRDARYAHETMGQSQRLLLVDVL